MKMGEYYSAKFAIVLLLIVANLPLINTKTPKTTRTMKRFPKKKQKTITTYFAVQNAAKDEKLIFITDYLCARFPQYSHLSGNRKYRYHELEKLFLISEKENIGKQQSRYFGRIIGFVKRLSAI